jgi:hypothetical protein
LQTPSVGLCRCRTRRRLICNSVESGESFSNYPVVIGDETLGKQYGLNGMPLTVRRL